MPGPTLCKSRRWTICTPAPSASELILAADVLYDRANLPLLDLLQARTEMMLLADSRIRDLAHPGFTRIAELQACTLPDLAEPDEFSRVALYQG